MNEEKVHRVELLKTIATDSMKAPALALSDHQLAGPLSLLLVLLPPAVDMRRCCIGDGAARPGSLTLQPRRLASGHLT